MKTVRLPAATCAALLGLLALAPGLYAEDISPLDPGVAAQIKALQTEKASRTNAQWKMDSQLIYALKQSQGKDVAQGVTSLRVAVPKNPQDPTDPRVLVDIKAPVTTSLLDFIQSSGGTNQSSVPRYQAIRALVPIELTEVLAGRSDVLFIRAAVPAIRQTGSVDSEGDTTHRAISARSRFLTDGTGVRVGVLSDSVDYMAQAVASGDLPPDVLVLPGQAGTGAGEGTAMLEIINDLAPGAKLAFATAMASEASFAQNIIDLQGAGCDIIVDDVIYSDESPFQDGPVAQAVNTVTAQGALYFSAAGDYGSVRHNTSGTWEGDFADGGPTPPQITGTAGNVHSFGNTTADSLTAAGNWVALFWADPLGASTNDYDLYLLDAAGSNVVASSTTVQNGLQDPYEYIAGANAGERVIIVKVSGDARFLHLDTGGGTLAINTTGSIRGHAAATNAMAVAATDALNAFPSAFSGGAANPAEAFSSDGPRRVFYAPDGTPLSPGSFLAAGGVLRQKPDITAADGASTTLPPGSGLNPFYGTSCAAPHAAAIAALVKSYSPNLAPSEIYAVLTNSALDIEADGWDINSGVGIAMAYQALQLCPPPAALPRFVVVTNMLFGGNGTGVAGIDECDGINVVIQNVGRVTATSVRATLSTVTPNTAIAQGSSAYPDLPISVSATNLTTYGLSIASVFKCGTTINLMLVIKCDQLTQTNFISFPTGYSGTPLRFNSSAPAAIPELNSTNSVIMVTNMNYVIKRVSASMFITEQLDSALVIQLIAPDGTVCTLAQNEGGTGQNFGVDCAPDAVRTTFDDLSTNLISRGTAPFTGTFVPEQSLATFNGKFGTNVNGAWKLRVVNQNSGNSGTINCWSLFLMPTICTDGGGECPGADLCVGAVTLPEPVMLGGYLTYNIAVTNFGPSTAKGVVVSQVLPASAAFVSATPSQGSAVQAGGVLTWSLGQMNFGTFASLSVRVLPSSVGLASSSITASSEQPDPNLANNSVTLFSHINPPAADLSVGISALPNPTYVNGPLTYTVTVTNSGPATAFAVMVTNVLASTVVVHNASVSQGSLAISGNIVVASLGNISLNGTATISIPVTPAAPGTLLATATVASPFPDPVPGNNSASVTTVVTPATDLALTFTGLPSPVIAQNNLTYSLTVTNLGPNPATGVALNGQLPQNVVVVSSTSTGESSVTFPDVNLFAASLGSLAAGEGAVVTLTVSTAYTATNLLLTATAAVTGNEFDSNTTNNTASLSTLVAPPFISVIPAGATLASESGPVNFAVDKGETVTVVLRLQNIGNVGTSNLVCTLMATGGVTPLGTNPPPYGALSPGGLSVVGRSYTFRADGPDGGTVTATLHLTDGSVNLGNVSFYFTLPTTVTFTNLVPIVISEVGKASPYPSAITVSGVTGTVGRITATFSNLAHTYPYDIDALLVSPSGRNSILMSGAAEYQQFLTNVDMTFDSDAAQAVPGSGGQIVSGAYRPADYAQDWTLPSPAPVPPYSASMFVFSGADPNGLWSLYVDDREPGDDGFIAGGWSLSVTLISPVAQLADLAVSGVTSPNPAVVGANYTNTFTITNNGPAAASAVAFSGILPAGVTLVSFTNSQGSLAVLGGTNLTGSLGSMLVGATATVTVVLTPGIGSGFLTNTASVWSLSGEGDLRLDNNTNALATAFDLPAADLALTQSYTPGSPVTVTSNVTYTLSVTNKGPGVAFNARIADNLPGLVNLNVNLGHLPAHAATNYVFVVNPNIVRDLINTASVSTDSHDTTPANNSSTSVVQVAPLAPKLVAGATLLRYESGPINGMIDPGETVAVSLTLTNIGSASTSPNFTATLLAGGGVTSPSGSGNYGALAPGQSFARSFSFTASGSPGGQVTATLQLSDGATSLGTVTFTFTLSAATVWQNTGAITIPDHGTASPYPSSIVVSGLTGTVSKVSVTLYGLTHNSAQDINVLLVSPSGANVLLMSHAGSYLSANNLTLTFDDSAAATLASGARLTSGTSRPSAYGAVTFPYVAAPYGSTLSALNWSNPNGTWMLYVYDDSPGDSGVISGGWAINLTTGPALTPLVDLAVGISSSPVAVYAGSSVTNRITVTNLGPISATGVYVSQSLPAGVSFLSQYSPGILSGGQITYTFGNLPVGGTASISFVTAPFPGGVSTATVLTNVVTVAANEETINPLHATASSTTIIYRINPAVLSGSLLSGSYQLTVTAQPGMTYIIQASTDLMTWAPISTNVANASGILGLTSSGAFPYRFFRTELVQP